MNYFKVGRDFFKHKKTRVQDSKITMYQQTLGQQ
jgi:hypothetical protein